MNNSLIYVQLFHRDQRRWKTKSNVIYFTTLYYLSICCCVVFVGVCRTQERRLSHRNHSYYTEVGHVHSGAGIYCGYVSTLIQ